MPVVLSHKNNRSTLSITERLKADSYEGFLLVVPTQRRIRYLTREIIEIVPGQVVPALPIYTLESLASRLFESIYSSLSFTSDPVQTLLFHNAVVRRRNELSFFGLRGRELRLPLGTFEKVTAVIKNLKESGIYPEILEEEVATAESDEIQKLLAVLSIYKEYEVQLELIKGIDVGGLYRLLNRDCPQSTFNRKFGELFPRVDMISIAGFDEFTEPEMGFIKKLCEVPGVSISLVFDFLRGNAALFGHLEENYHRFLELGFLEARHDSSSSVDPNPLMIHKARPAAVQHAVDQIAARLFSSVPAPRLGLSRDVTTVKARDRAREVEVICKIIKRLVLDSPGRDLSRVCVAMYRPQLYTDLFRELTVKFGIPVNITDRFDLSRSPVVVSILNLLRISTRGFRRDDVLRGVSTRYFDLWVETSRLDTANLASVSQRLKITGGLAAWRRRIDNEGIRINSELRNTTEEHGSAVLKRELRSLLKARSDIEWLLGLLKEIAGEVTPRQFYSRLVTLLDRLHVSFRILKHPGRTPGDLVERDSRAYGKFLDVVDQMVQLIEFQEGKDKTHTLEFYLEQLKVAVSQERYNVREQFRRGVLVTSIEETRGLPLDVMIVAGLVDGEFPSVYQPEIFFSTNRQRQRQQRHTWENRYLFYQAITNWSEHLYLTYPEQDADLDLVRSTFVDATLSIAEVEFWEYPGNTPFGSDLFSEEEVLHQYGRAVGRGRDVDEQLARYVQEKAPAIRESIAIERSRVDTHLLPEYEGVLSGKLSEEGKAKLAQFRDRVYSVSQLETYGKCPYQFFARRVLRLSTIEEFEEGLSPLEKGSVLHETLYEFYAQRRDKNLPLLSQCTEEEFESAVTELVGIAEKKFREKEIPDPFWQVEQQLILGDVAEEGLLRKFLEVERGRTAQFVPGYFEVGFGSTLGLRTATDRVLSREAPLCAGNVKLRGKVDRVEIGDEAFTIIDYKTGKTVPRYDDIRKGISLQLPIYLYAVEELLKDHLQHHLHPAGGMYYQLGEAVHLKLGLGSAEYNNSAFEVWPRLSQLLKTNEAFRAVIDTSIQWVNSYVDDIVKGRFPLTTPDKVAKVCSICDFKTVCRIQTVQRVESQQMEEQ